MNIPDDLRYTKDHEWVRVEDDVVTVGITDHAQQQLGDIVFIELPKVGEDMKESETFGAVESVKSVSDCLAPVSGKVLEVNELLQENPETINEDCYAEGWMLKLQLADETSLDDLMSREEYEQYLKEESV